MPPKLPPASKVSSGSEGQYWQNYIKDCDKDEEEDEDDEEDFLEILYDHCAQWHERKIVKQSRGIYGTASMLTWKKCALFYPELGLDDNACRLTLKEFSMLRLPRFLLHTKTGYQPILCMDLLETMNTLEALEWTVFSNPFRRTYTDVWWNKAFQLFSLLLRRCFFLANGEFNVSVLNMEEYVNKEIVDARIHYLNKIRDDNDDYPGNDMSSVVTRESSRSTVTVNTVGRGGGGGGGGGEVTKAIGSGKVVKRAYCSSSSSSSSSDEEDEEEEEEGEAREKNGADASASSDDDDDERDATRRSSGQNKKEKEGGDEAKKNKKKKSRVPPPNIQPLPKTVGGKQENVTIYDANRERSEEDKNKLTIAYTSLKWLFDIDTITTSFLLYAYHHERVTPPEPIPDNINLIKFRTWLFAEIKKEPPAEVLTFRRIWYDNLIVPESYLRIFCRKNPMDPRPASRAIIMSKHEEFHQEHCKSVEEVCDENATGVLSRMNTDAMVFMKARSLSSSTGNITTVVYRKTFMDVKGEDLCIYRDPIRNGWILYFSKDRSFIAKSFTAAFVYMRMRMRMLNMGNFKDEYDISVWDAYFFT